MRPSSSSESSVAAVRDASPRARAGQERRPRRGFGRGLMLLAAAWLLAAAPAAPAAGKARVRYVTSNGVRYLYLADVADLFGMR
ncbi:MAG: hypothetical protein GX595_02330, partial [Lentisphaerae bacterium]|nr:hypothetical protein [Lentisphaerota bacterium]